MQSGRTRRAALPSIDALIRMPDIASLIEVHGRALVTETAREIVAELRSELASSEAGDSYSTTAELIRTRIKAHLTAAMQPPLVPVFNLTGTVLHTNLGRALLPKEAIAAVALAAGQPSNLEYDLEAGRRGDRDAHLEKLLCRLTGAEASTVVNNNAAAVLLLLNTLALRKEVIVSRGELIEIGGSFRLPDIMARAGCKLREIGTTNRTHLSDYAAAISSRTALIMKLHTSNYTIQGFTSAVPERDLASLAKEHGLPFVVDLGSGSLLDLERYGLPHEPTPQELIGHGADLVTFSGDKLLGGPQAGVIVGRAELVSRLKKNPLARALRVDKMTIAALAVILHLLRNPEKIADRLPTLRFLTRPQEDIAELAHRLCPALVEALRGHASVEVVACKSQIGSGALPVDLLPSMALAIRAASKRGAGLHRIASAFRALPIPVIGRIEKATLLFDLRCLDDEAAFIGQLGQLFAAGDGR